MKSSFFKKKKSLLLVHKEKLIHTKSEDTKVPCIDRKWLNQKYFGKRTKKEQR